RPRRAAGLDAIGPFNQRALGRRSGCDIWHAPDYLDRTNGQEPAPLVAIAAWGSASEHWLVVDSSVRSVKELENKTLATSRPKSADHGYIIAILERFGVDPRRVTFLSAGGQGGRLAAVQSGRVTGSVFNRYYTIRLKKDGFRDIAKLERP